jgi:transcriptional regulator of nitric oxide reductase
MNFRALTAFIGRSARFAQAALIALCASLAAQGALAGILTKEDVQRRFKIPYEVQDKLADPPVWPVTSALEKEAGPVAYAYETIDISPLPGFDGNPMNFLVSIDRKGVFLNVELLQQREPVFTFRDLGGYGDTLLRQFIAQYSGKSLSQPFIVSLDPTHMQMSGPKTTGVAMLDGIAKATTSVRIVNQTVLSSALDVARAKMGFADRRTRGPSAKVNPNVFDRVTFEQMLKKGMIGHLTLTNREMEKLFEGSDGAGTDDEALAHPDANYIDFYIAYLNAPTIGRAILGDDQYRELMARNFDNRQLWWVGGAGRFQIVDDDFIPGAPSPVLAMSQDGGFLDFRDQNFEDVRINAPVKLNMSRIFGLRSETDVDPAAPLDFVLSVTRAKGQMLPTFTQKQVKLSYQPPALLFTEPQKPISELQAAWKSRFIDLVAIGASLALLAIMLARPRWLVSSANRLRYFRLGFLAYTLVFIGWHAQGQLSVVQITGALKSLSKGADLTGYLYDPVSLLLIAFTFISFFIWGRGTFCGWLCPFGALQEFVGLLAEKLKIPQVRIPAEMTKHMEQIRYGALAVLAATAVVAPNFGESLTEIEPFKTTFTLGFNRGWPFIAYVVLLLVAAALYYKMFCRFICPLGGAMSLGGKLRLFDWIDRRAECGKPCQRCKVDCKYDAIEKSGEIRYGACFQCLDCVSIYHDAKRCVPIMLYEKKKKTLTPLENTTGIG